MVKYSDALKAQKKIEWRASPEKFFVEALDVKPEHLWDMMVLMCQLIMGERKIAVKAGHSVSKSYTMARIVLWYLYCHCPSTVITTAPTHTQVEEILWREIREAHSNARLPLGGNLTKTKLDLQGIGKGKKSLRWFAYGFSTKPDQGQENATKMQGFHNEYMMVLFDEADGILPAIWRAVDALLTSPKVKFVAIGNPLRPTGEFADCFSDSSFKTLTISVLDTPNYKEGKEVIPGLSGQQYEQDMAAKWGRDSAMYKSRVLGEIPDTDPQSIVPVSWYERAENREPYSYDHKKRFIVVDVADGGADDTVVKGFENKTQISESRYPGKRADEIYGDVIRECKLINGNTIVYDHDGCGRILGGLLRGVLGKDSKIRVIAFEGSADAHDEDFDNRRAESHYLMHKDFKDNKISVFAGNARAKEDVTGVRWGEPRKNKITVEPKKHFKKRLGGRSPDDGDTIMMMCGCYDQIIAIEVVDMYVDKQKGWQPKDWMGA